MLFLFVGAFIWSVLHRYSYEFSHVPEFSGAETTDLSQKAIQADETFNPEVNPSVVGHTNYQDKKLFVNEEFTSHLPLIVIDTGEQQPKLGVVWDNNKGYYIPTGEDPYAYGEIFVINNSDGVNQPGDKAETHSLCKLKLRGNSSGNYDKKQYLIKLLDEDGRSERKNILEMGSDNEWILNVSFIDKSLLRNYLAYTAADEVMPYSPDVRFCEVLWKVGDVYCYEGVYMMMESVKVGKHRVDLPQYTDNGTITPALLRRDRYNVNGLMLDNYATQNELTPGYLDIEYPDKDVITEKGIHNITEQVNRFERALYADSWDEFIAYRQYINMDSFVDYFILNEFFMNYDAGHNSTYLYMDYSGKINMGPVWDFDQAMDNNATQSAILDTTAFHSAPWFDRMLQDPIFTDRIIKRYAELRTSILSDESIEEYVRATTAYLGKAIERDWARWGYYYKDGNYLKPDPFDGKERNTFTYEQEVERILNVLSVHGAWMDEHLDSLYQFSKISLEEAETQLLGEKSDIRPALAVVFIAVFLVSVKLVLKYESE